MAPERLTRDESKARTRSRLLAAAAEEFAERGLDRTTIERVAERAGYSKGAFYANFEDKDQLCLVMLDETFSEYLAGFTAALAEPGEPERRARRAGDHLSRAAQDDPAGQRLFFEFAIYALRNEEFRLSLVHRYEHLRSQVEETFRRRSQEMGVESPIPMNRLAKMMFITGIGAAFGTLLEPESLDEDLYGETLVIFFAGLRATAASDRSGQ